VIPVSPVAIRLVSAGAAVGTAAGGTAAGGIAADGIAAVGGGPGAGARLGDAAPGFGARAVTPAAAMAGERTTRGRARRGWGRGAGAWARAGGGATVAVGWAIGAGAPVDSAMTERATWSSDEGPRPGALTTTRTTATAPWSASEATIEARRTVAMWSI
jgi:hypothetical protein